MAITTVNLIDMLVLESMVNDMLADHRSIILARRYHDGDQDIHLDSRMQEFLDLHTEVKFRLNVCKTVVSAVRDELNVIGFGTTEQAGEDGRKAQAEWAWTVWQQNRMDALQGKVHETALRDRETFVIVDWDSENKRPRLTHQLRFTDTDADGGTGQGCWIVYENDDPDQPPRAAVKQWTEQLLGPDGQVAYRTRRTVYYPDHIEKWYYDADWVRLEEDIAWKDRRGRPLGIPVIHFKNANLRPEAWDAIPMQDAINKQFIDVLATSDMTGFPILKAIGFYPTLDGQAPKEDGSNLLEIRPGGWVGTTKSKSEADIDKIPGTDVTPMVSALKDLIILTAQITDTPVSRFVASGQVAGMETLKEQEKPLKKKAADRRVLFGNAWEDCMTMARKLANRFGNARLDEYVLFSTLWQYSDSLDDLKQHQELGVPQETIWRRMGYSEAEIADMKKTDEYRLKIEKLLWEASEKAVAAGIVLETYLLRVGWTKEQLQELGTQKLAAIKLQQEDRVPETGQ